MNEFEMACSKRMKNNIKSVYNVMYHLALLRYTISTHLNVLMYLLYRKKSLFFLFTNTYSVM